MGFAWREANGLSPFGSWYSSYGSSSITCHVNVRWPIVADCCGGSHWGTPQVEKRVASACYVCNTHTRARAHTVLGCTAQRFACVRAAFMPPTHAACRSAACASDSLGPSPRAVRHKAKAANTTIGRPTGDAIARALPGRAYLHALEAS